MFLRNNGVLTVTSPLQVPAFERAVSTAGDDLSVAAEEPRHHHRAAVASQRVLPNTRDSRGQVRSGHISRPGTDRQTTDTG